MSSSSSAGPNNPSLDTPYTSSLNKCIRSCPWKYAYQKVRMSDDSIVERKRIFCNRWSCDRCGPSLKSKLTDRIAKQTLEWQLNRFMTLTANPDTEGSYVASFRDMKRCFKKFRASMTRRFKGDFKCIWILGISETRSIHLHLLINRSIPQKELSLIWQRCGGGRIVDIRREYDLAFRAGYLVKHLTNPDYPRGTRKYGSSKAISLKIDRLVYPWELVPRLDDLERLATQYRVSGKKYDAEGRLVRCIVRQHFHREHS
jgi:hypothetical protein